MGSAKVMVLMVVLMMTVPVSAQKFWTLEECITYAFDHNLTLKQRALAVKQAEIGKKEARMASLPSLNGNVSNGYNFGRSIDPFTNQFVQQNITNYRFGINTGVVLFNGLQIYNNNKMQQQLVEASRFDYEVTQNDIGLNIANAFLQVLFAQELLKSGFEQVKATEEQLNRTETFFKAGRLPESAVLDLKAQLANNQLTKVNAENQLSMAKLNLFLLLDLSPEENEVITPNLDTLPREETLNPDQLYLLFSARAPELKAAQSRYNASLMSLRMAKGAYSPRLTLGADISTLYSENFRQVTATRLVGYSPQLDPGLNTVLVPIQQPTAYEVTPFSNQLNNNLGQTVGLQMSVPIFNNYRTAAGVQRAQLEVDNNKISLGINENNIKRQIRQAYTEYQAAKARYQASLYSYQAQEESFTYATKRFENQLLSSPEYRILENNKQAAYFSMVQAKYELMFRYKILEFYKTGNIRAN